MVRTESYGLTLRLGSLEELMTFEKIWESATAKTASPENSGIGRRC